MSDQRVLFPNPIRLNPTATRPNEVAKKTAATQTFEKILTNEVGQIQFSQHALQRMQSRNMQLKPEDVQKLTDAVSQVAQKGGKESLVVYNQMAFVVSVPNKTVITAMDKQSMKNNVFTQIDSAVIL